MTDPWVTAQTLNGPRVAEWIKQEFPDYAANETVKRRVSGWERGHEVNLATLDRQLVRLGGCLSLVPDEVFTETREPTGEVVPLKQKPAVLEPKWCEVCGQRIPEHWPNGRRKQPYRWAKTRHCSNDCRYATAGRMKFGKAAA